MITMFVRCWLLAAWSVGWLVVRLVCHNVLKGQKVTLPCFYWSTCFIFNFYFRGIPLDDDKNKDKPEEV